MTLLTSTAPPATGAARQLRIRAPSFLPHDRVASTEGEGAPCSQPSTEPLSNVAAWPTR